MSALPAGIRPRAVVLLSDGLDSITVLALVTEDRYACTALSFQYGQRHAVELERAAKIASHFGAEYRVMDVNLGSFGGGSVCNNVVRTLPWFCPPMSGLNLICTSSTTR